jgi:hypothetical protein
MVSGGHQAALKDERFVDWNFGCADGEFSARRLVIEAPRDFFVFDSALVEYFENSLWFGARRSGEDERRQRYDQRNSGGDKRPPARARLPNTAIPQHVQISLSVADRERSYASELCW